MKLQTKPLSWFRPNPVNFRQHPVPQVTEIATSLEQLGQFKNVVARPDGTLLAGHGVVAAAQQLALKELAVFVFEGTDAEAEKLLVADNTLSRGAEDDDAQLAKLLGLIAADSGLSGTGFDEEALEKLRAAAGLTDLPDPGDEWDPIDEGFDTSTVQFAFGPYKTRVDDTVFGEFERRWNAHLGENPDALLEQFVEALFSG